MRFPPSYQIGPWHPDSISAASKSNVAFDSPALTGHAFADDITPSEPFVSTATRADVQAAITQARGTASPWSIAYNPLATLETSRTRAEVRAEYIASRDEVAALTAEDSGAFAMAQQQPVNTQVAIVLGTGAAE